MSSVTLYNPNLVTGRRAVSFQTNVVDNQRYQALSISFKDQVVAEKSARFFMMKLMQAIASGTIGPVISIRFSHHDGKREPGRLPSGTEVCSPQGIIESTASQAADQIKGELDRKGLDFKPDHVYVNGPQRPDKSDPRSLLCSRITVRWVPGTEWDPCFTEITIWDPTNAVDNDPPPFRAMAEGMREFCTSAGGTFREDA